MIYNLFLIRSVGHANQMLINCGIFHAFYDFPKFPKLELLNQREIHK